MNIEQRKSINDNLKKYDYLAKDNDFIEVTEWVNGEGIDVNINGDNTLNISLTRGQLEAINYLCMSLDYQEK